MDDNNKYIRFDWAMKADGMPVAMMAKYTGLTAEEIEKL